MRPSAPLLAAALSAAIALRAFAGQQPAIDFAAGASAAAAVRETEHLAVTVSSGPAAAPGSRVSLFVHVTPKPKMHVYAPGQQTYIPVSVQVRESPLVTAHKPVFPRAEKYFFEPLQETHLVYSRPFRIVQDVTLADAPVLHTMSTLTVNGTVRYQACDDRICYLPKSVDVRWKVPLAVRNVTR